jgi:hypothetical protein
MNREKLDLIAAILLFIAVFVPLGMVIWVEYDRRKGR